MPTPETATVSLLANWLDTVIEMYIVDLRALADEDLYKSIGGEARTAHHITTEVAMMMKWITRTLEGECVPSPTDSDHLALMDSAQSKTALIQLIEECGREFKNALTSATPERLEAEVETPFGGTRKVLWLANIYINHVWYHDGQLNVIQAFRGDNQVHW